MHTKVLIDLKSIKYKNLFKYYCKKNGFTMSKFITNKVKEFIKMNEQANEKEVLNK